MHNVKKKGFTLIELIAVLVILAIIALIATPLVMSIIRHAKLSADKRSIDAYGRSIELAIAGYLLDTGKFPTEVSQLTIEYSGNEVECSTTQINPDSSVYLSDCKVNNREVSNYTYGSDKSPTYQTYKVGDTVTYNDIDFYVIKDSGTKESTVTLLKAEPLTSNDVENYLPKEYDGITGFSEGYGTIKYGLLSSFSSSYVKNEIDAWALDRINSSDVKESRLIKFEELRDNFGYEYKASCSTCSSMAWIATENTPNWLKAFSSWTMSKVEDSSNVWVINGNTIISGEVDSLNRIRPVVELYKSALN